MKIPMKLVPQYMAIFLDFSLNSNHPHPLQIENCDSNSRLVVDEDDNGKFRLEKVKCTQGCSFIHSFNREYILLLFQKACICSFIRSFNNLIIYLFLFHSMIN